MVEPLAQGAPPQKRGPPPCHTMPDDDPSAAGALVASRDRQQVSW